MLDYASGTKPDQCRGCPLYKRGLGFVWSSGPHDARLLALGEAPGKVEREKGYGFAGPSGADLDRGLQGERPRVRCSNVRKCQPPDDESDEERAGSIAHCTRAYLSPELAALPEVRATAAIGGDALQTLSGLHAYTRTDDNGKKIHEPGIMQYHGSVFRDHEVEFMRHELVRDAPPGRLLPPRCHSVVVTLHPAFAMRGMPHYRPEILANIGRARALSHQEAPLRRAETMDIKLDVPGYQLLDHVGASDRVVIDVETPRDEAQHILIAGMSPGPDTAYVVDWTEDAQDEFELLAQSTSRVKIGHNFPYDIHALEAYGIEVAYPIVDTIVGGARLWPPVPQKKLLETTKKKIPDKRLSLAKCALRLLADCVYWKQPETLATEAFYRAAFPEFSFWQYLKLYCALDCIYNHRLWLAMRELLRQQGLLERFQRIDMPALLPIVHMESRGMCIDEDRRAALIDEATTILGHMTNKIAAVADEHHRRRYDAVEVTIHGLEERLSALPGSVVERCPKHPEYYGLVARTKCPGCAGVFAAAAPTTAAIKDLRGRIREGKTVLARIGEHFDVAKADHWRWLLFSADGLNQGKPKSQWIKPVAYTEEREDPKVDADTMEVLQRRHPDIELFRWKIEATYAAYRLNGPLAVEVSPKTGRAHAVIKMHKTATARLASGTDEEEADKIRFSAAGNQQNVTDRDRSMYVPPTSEHVCLVPDWSQIEARVTAWRAREFSLLDAWRRGEDIHVLNARALARAVGGNVNMDREEAEATVFPYDPQRKSYRDNGKIITHACDYGKTAHGIAKDYGIPLPIAQRIYDEYFGTFPGLARRNRDVEAEAIERRYLRNAFGLKLGPYERTKRDGKWVLKDREDALAAQPQSDVGDMCKAVLLPLDRLCDDVTELVTTQHDGFVFYTPKSQAPVLGQQVRKIMERTWEELGPLDCYGMFFCPSDISVGRNWGKQHVHTERCAQRLCNGLENPFGLEKLKAAA